MLLARLIVFVTIILTVTALEAFSIWEIWGGSFHWAAVFAIITALNVRAAAVDARKASRK